MMLRLKNILPTGLFVLLAIQFLLGLGPVHAEEPVVVVVHGVGDGNREDGWSRDAATQWGVGPVEEVTFRYPGRTVGMSFVDFARLSGDWTLHVRDRLREIARKNPGRSLVIVSHSWGSVTTKLALMGGYAGGQRPELEASGYEIKPASELRVAEWITLGSPLGRAHQTNVALNLRQLQVYVPDGRPANVANWTNFYDVDDPVSLSSQHLTGANNVAVRGSGSWWDISGVTAHTGIWVNPAVKQHVRTVVNRITFESDRGEQGIGRKEPGTPVSEEEKKVFYQEAENTYRTRWYKYWCENPAKPPSRYCGEPPKFAKDRLIIHTTYATTRQHLQAMRNRLRCYDPCIMSSYDDRQRDECIRRCEEQFPFK